MNPRELMAAFEVVAEAPDGVKRLRELVLQLAVRGKLVRQDARDQSARAALEQLRPTKAKKAGRVAEPVTSPPFSPPEGWEWIRVAEAGSIQLGRQRSPDNHHGPHMVPYLRVANVQEARLDLSDIKLMNFSPDEQEKFRLVSGDVLLNEGQSYELVGRPAIYRGEIPGCCFQNTLLRFRVYEVVTPEYALTVFRAYMWSGEFRAEAQQTTNIAHLSAGRLAQIAFPLPPLAEQHRIVARVDELMGLLDRLEAARTARDDLRRAARDAALAALRDAEDTDAVEAAWSRIASQMDALFTEPEDVGPLRQAVLGLAVRGRLVPTRPSAATTTGPFPIPTGWSWKTMLELTETITSGSRNWNQFYSATGATFIRSQDIKHDRLEYDDRAYVTVPGGSEGTRTRVNRGDWLITITGANVGKCALLGDHPGEAYVSQHVALMRPKNLDFGRFGHIWLTADHGGRGILLADSYGAKPGLNLQQLRSLPVPVPPPRRATPHRRQSRRPHGPLRRPRSPPHRRPRPAHPIRRRRRPPS